MKKKWFVYLDLFGNKRLRKYTPAAYDDALESNLVLEVSSIIEADNRKQAEELATLVNFPDHIDRITFSGF